VTRLLALSIVLLLSGVPALAVLCEGWCPMTEPAARSAADTDCHEQAASHTGLRVASRHHDCDHQLSVTAAVVTEARHGAMPAGSSLPAVLEARLPTVAAARASFFSGLRGSPPRSAPSSSLVLRI
jgi:hypothetical protein